MAHITARTAALGAIALALGTSAASAQTIYYEDGDYLYAVPAAESVAVENDVVTSSVVVPVTPPDGSAVRVIPPRDVVTQQPIVLPDAAVAPASLPVIIPQGVATGYGQAYAPASYGYGTRYLPNGAQVVEFDREAWLTECRSRLAGYDENDRGRVIGALTGAVVGGVIGNRVADGNRLGGTLLGAGVGGLTGSAIGDAIDDRADRRSFGSIERYCTDYLDDYMARASNYGATTYGAAYAPGQQYMLVPVTVPVAQQVVYREYTGTER